MTLHILRAPAFIVGLLASIVALHIGASVSGMYWNTGGLFQELHLDWLFHGLGGFWIGSVFFYYVLRRSDIFNVVEHRVVACVAALGMSALAGVLWEFFEFALDSYAATEIFGLRQQWGVRDTMFDLAFDLTGAFIASFFYLMALRRGVNRS